MARPDEHRLLEMRKRFGKLADTGEDLYAAMLVSPADKDPSPIQEVACRSIVCEARPVRDKFAIHLGDHSIQYICFGTCSDQRFRDFTAHAITSTAHLFKHGDDVPLFNVALSKPITHRHWIMFLFSLSLQQVCPDFIQRRWLFLVPPRDAIPYGNTMLHAPNLVWTAAEPALQQMLEKNNIINQEPLRQDELVPLPVGPADYVLAFTFQHNLFRASAAAAYEAWKKIEPPPLTDLQRKVLELIKAQPPGQGITGKAIVDALAGTEHATSHEALRSRIIPVLKQDHGVVNYRGNRGYMIRPQ